MLYVVGLFLLALGSTFSIIADIGVSPVTSLAYALALDTGLSVGIMTFVANFIYIIFQVIFLKQIRWKNFSIQLIIAFLFGSFMDVTMWLTKPLPDADSIWLIVLYFVLSLFLVAFALLFYFTAGLPTMPYDSLTHVIANKWKLSFWQGENYERFNKRCRITHHLFSVYPFLWRNRYRYVHRSLWHWENRWVYVKTFTT